MYQIYVSREVLSEDWLGRRIDVLFLRWVYVSGFNEAS